MGSSRRNFMVTILCCLLYANMRVGHLYLLIFYLMTLSESSAGLTLADFLYSRLSPISKYNVKSDYHRHNPPGEHHNNSQKPPTHILRGPRFIAADVRPEQTKGKQVSRAVSSFRAALNNIVGIKESLFRTLLSPPRPRGKKPYEGVGTDQGSEDVGTVGGSDWEQFNSGNNYFRPSLTDPLRPTVTIISSVPAGSAPTRFLPPRERTKIDTAVVGQQVKPRRAENTEIKTQSYTVGSPLPLQHSVEKTKGRLKVPEERTFIDTAVFADDIFQKKPLPTRTFEPLRTSQTQSESSDSSWVILGGDKSQINSISGEGGEASASDIDLTGVNSTPIILKNTKLRLQNPYAEVAYSDNEEKNQEFDFKLSIPKSSKSDILSEK